MIFKTEVWFGLCKKLTTYQLVNILMSFGPTHRAALVSNVTVIYTIKLLLLLLLVVLIIILYL